MSRDHKIGGMQVTIGKSDAFQINELCKVIDHTNVIERTPLVEELARILKAQPQNLLTVMGQTASPSAITQHINNMGNYGRSGFNAFLDACSVSQNQALQGYAQAVDNSFQTIDRDNGNITVEVTFPDTDAGLKLLHLLRESAHVKGKNYDITPLARPGLRTRLQAADLTVKDWGPAGFVPTGNITQCFTFQPNSGDNRPLTFADIEDTIRAMAGEIGGQDPIKTIDQLQAKIQQDPRFVAAEKRSASLAENCGQSLIKQIETSVVSECIIQPDNRDKINNLLTTFAMEEVLGYSGSRQPAVEAESTIQQKQVVSEPGQKGGFLGRIFGKKPEPDPTPAAPPTPKVPALSAEQAQKLDAKMVENFAVRLESLLIDQNITPFGRLATRSVSESSSTQVTVTAAGRELYHTVRNTIKNMITLQRLQRGEESGFKGATDIFTHNKEGGIASAIADSLTKPAQTTPAPMAADKMQQAKPLLEEALIAMGADFDPNQKSIILTDILISHELMENDKRNTQKSAAQKIINLEMMGCTAKPLSQGDIQQVAAGGGSPMVSINNAYHLGRELHQQYDNGMAL